jgi:hypothetical protein
MLEARTWDTPTAQEWSWRCWGWRTLVPGCSTTSYECSQESCASVLTTASGRTAGTRPRSTAGCWRRSIRVSKMLSPGRSHLFIEPEASERARRRDDQRQCSAEVSGRARVQTSSSAGAACSRGSASRSDRCRDRAGVDPGGMEDLPYGGGADLVAESGQFAVDALVAQVGFSVARRRTRARTPGRACWMVQRLVTSRRCQRKIVAGSKSVEILAGDWPSAQTACPSASHIVPTERLSCATTHPLNVELRGGSRLSRGAVRPWSHAGTAA